MDALEKYVVEGHTDLPSGRCESGHSPSYDENKYMTFPLSGNVTEIVRNHRQTAAAGYEWKPLDPAGRGAADDGGNGAHLVT